MGTRKLLTKLTSFLEDNNISIGRDALFDLLRENNLLVKRKKRYMITTNSKHWFKKYPNLIKDLTPQYPNSVWASDITYWKCNDKHLYISFITDTYSHKIVGWNVADTLETVNSTKALKMALNNFNIDSFTGKRLIHHSDRGIQYCSKEYVKVLKKYNIEISMTQSGDPLDNSIAERINGIMKNEYLFHYYPDDLHQAKQVLERCVRLYNTERPHNSIGNFTPDIIHYKTGMKTKKLWKNYYTPKGKKLTNQIDKTFSELEILTTK